ncbi:hypothetical protein AYI70_g8118 [Smittium culicis]|uniref:RGS domain-containing protein n=1 Tax=Smittium culicis TaxID=133412 RepID=A0A1R1XHF2_9FUNG|nr:hypothetical protein AYI70_g8118 [Smittium culicis]
MADNIIITNIFNNEEFMDSGFNSQIGGVLIPGINDQDNSQVTPSKNTDFTPTIYTPYTTFLTSVQNTQFNTDATLTQATPIPTDSAMDSNGPQSVGPSPTGSSFDPDMVMPNIIGKGIDDSPKHIQELKSRSSSNPGHQFVTLAIMIGYTMLILYTLWMYHLRTAPSRRGFRHRSIKLLVLQVALNLIISIATLIYIGFDLTSFLFMILIFYTGLISWFLSLLFRALKAIYFISFNKAKVNYFSFLKAQNNRSTIGSEFLRGESSGVYSDLINTNHHSLVGNISNMDIVKITSDYERKLSKLNSQKAYYRDGLITSFIVGYIVISAIILVTLERTNNLSAPKISVGNKLMSNGWLISYFVVHSVFGLVIFPACSFALRRYREFRFLVIELISVSILSTVTMIAFSIWHKIIGEHKIFALSPSTTIFILLLISHIFSVVFPMFKMKNYSVAYTTNDYANPTVRRNTRSASKNFKSSFTGKSADYRREFLSMLDSENMYSQLKKFSKEYISYDLILFLDEYQILKKRVLEELDNNENNSMFRVSYAENAEIDNSMDRINSYKNNKYSESNISDKIKFNDFQSSGTLKKLSNGENNDFIPDSHILSPGYEKSHHLNIGESTNPNTIMKRQSKFDKVQNKSDHANKNGFSSIIVDRLLTNTPMSITICDALEYLYPNVEINPNSIVPNKLKPIFQAFCNTFINPNSNLTMNIHRSIIDDVMENYRVGEFTIGIFDDAREEVLDLLYFGVFPYYLESKNLKNAKLYKRHHFSLNKNFIKP